MPKTNAARSLSITSQDSYAAVIIADMVAEVQSQSETFPKDHRNNSIKSDGKAAIRRNNSTKSDGQTFNRKGSTNLKDETNLGFEDSAAVVNVDSETVNVGMAKTNGTDITKGVILNTQLEQKLSSEYFKVGKPIELNNVHAVQVAEGGKASKEKELSSDFSAMSIPRKVAFVFSFLPSIMFVLCFAIILPCNKKLPCVQQMWTTTLNNTVTSGIKDPGSIVFTFSHAELNGLKGLDANSGEFQWASTLLAPPRSLDCGMLTANDSQTCLVSDVLGNLHFYNASTGHFILHGETNKGGVGVSSLPAILPDCDGDGVSEVAVAVSEAKIKVIFLAFTMYPVTIQGCDSTPSRLTAWQRENQTDLVFICRNGTHEHLFRMTQDKWCAKNKKAKGKGGISTLDTRELGVLEQSLLLPTREGFVLWTEDEVTMFEPNGRKKWTASSESHSGQNRFLLYGKFKEKNSQVALFSSDILTSLQVTTLNTETGKRAWNVSISNSEITNVTLIHGEKKDFVLVIRRKIEGDTINEAVAHLSEVSTTIINLLAKEEFDANTPNVTSSKMTEEILLMELNGDTTHVIDERKMSFAESETYSSIITAKESKEKLTILALKKPSSSASTELTGLRSISVANWDISQSQNQQCDWKH